MSLAINDLPRHVLESLNATQAVLYCSEDTGGVVKASTSLRPADLHPLAGVEVLNDVRVSEGVYAVTLTLLKLDARLAEQATAQMDDRFTIMAELDALLHHVRDVYLAYAVTHFNHRPLEELTVFVGGDCYRKDQPDLQAILTRTRHLSGAMLRKAVMVFPDIPTLHGGKKGEWIVLDAAGRKIDGLSETAIYALGTLVIPLGIGFLNDYKERRMREKGWLERFPERNYIRPDTASPDVLSGQYWPEMCRTWERRGLHLGYVTCLPDTLGGPLSSSARPTGYGIATTAVQLAERRFRGRPPHSLRYLVEALGNVSLNTLEALTQRFGVPGGNIVAFDPRAEVCKYARDKYHLDRTYALSHDEFYSKLAGDGPFDVWINNGLGNNTKPGHVERLLGAGVRLFCGAANNFLEVRSRRESLDRIFDAGGWTWPDEAASGGGWTLAVVDLYLRCQGRLANERETEELILRTITTRNERLVLEVLETARASEPAGRAIWDAINGLIEQRVSRTLAATPADLVRSADVSGWTL